MGGQNISAGGDFLSVKHRNSFAGASVHHSHVLRLSRAEQLAQHDADILPRLPDDQAAGGLQQMHTCIHHTLCCWCETSKEIVGACMESKDSIAIYTVIPRPKKQWWRPINHCREYRIEPRTTGLWSYLKLTGRNTWKRIRLDTCEGSCIFAYYSFFTFKMKYLHFRMMDNSNPQCRRNRSLLTASFLYIFAPLCNRFLTPICFVCQVRDALAIATSRYVCMCVCVLGDASVHSSDLGSEKRTKQQREIVEQHQGQIQKHIGVHHVLGDL